MFDFLATPVGIVLRTIHDGLSTFLASDSGLAWGLSIVLLTIVVRLLLFPLFVKQIKSQRRMQELAPMVKELQKKHKGDRETLNAEMMKLYKENNANPIAGCLPLLLQLPVFFALFTVIRNFGPDREPKYGLSSRQLEEGGLAQIFGAPIGANFRSTAEELATLGADSPTTVRIVAALMVIGMGLTTFWTQRQMIARSNTTDPQQVMVQKFLLYVLPLTFAVSGVIFPIGVLLYWLTTNVWSMGQQAWVIKRMPPPTVGGKTIGDGKQAGGKGSASGKGTGTGKAGLSDKGAPADGAAGKDGSGKGGGTVAAPGDAAAGSTSGSPGGGGSHPVTPSGTSGAARPSGKGATPPAAVSATAKRRPDGSRKNKNRRGGRR